MNDAFVHLVFVLLLGVVVAIEAKHKLLPRCVPLEVLLPLSARARACVCVCVREREKTTGRVSLERVHVAMVRQQRTVLTHVALTSPLSLIQSAVAAMQRWARSALSRA
jgi:hypothetical protein